MSTTIKLCLFSSMILWKVWIHFLIAAVVVKSSSALSLSSSIVVTESNNNNNNNNKNDTRRFGKQQQQQTSRRACSIMERTDHPVLCHMIDRVKDDIELLASEIHSWAKWNGLLVDWIDPDNNDNEKIHNNVQEDFDFSNTVPLLNQEQHLKRRHLQHHHQQQVQLPVVFAHGMGDSCFNDGLKSITEAVSKLLNGVYTVCIPIGTSQSEDTTNGYLLNMDASVDVFAQTIESDVILQKYGTFHAIGFSQGNNIIRGYIAKCNTKVMPVHTFLSVNGVNAGVGAVPYCIPKSSSSTSSVHHQHQSSRSMDDSSIVSFSMCDLLMEQASRSAYTEFAQQNSFQANYWRDPRKSIRSLYEQYSQLAIWNNENTVIGINETLRNNWSLTKQFVWILATNDKMVWPKEGEQWGQPNSNAKDPFTAPIVVRNETDWYQKDLFGLRTAEESGKNRYESFDGDHLQFSSTDFKKVGRNIFDANSSN